MFCFVPMLPEDVGHILSNTQNCLMSRMRSGGCPKRPETGLSGERNAWLIFTVGYLKPRDKAVRDDFRAFAVPAIYVMRRIREGATSAFSLRDSSAPLEECTSRTRWGCDSGAGFQTSENDEFSSCPNQRKKSKRGVLLKQECSARETMPTGSISQGITNRRMHRCVM